ncbi:hypothetical protein JB92DRAFT_1172673 [Gautieria morchelliformis]|nr:hypothetical protein JB92DRAFT_1172673 [Gautieria morchelliformis]
MAEALAGLGVGASVIAVVQLGKAVISTCSAYGTTYKNASKNMNQLSDEVARLVPVLGAIHELITDEETKKTVRLPTLIAAFIGNTPHDQTSDTSLENELGLEDGRTDSTPSSHTGRHAMVNSLWKFKTKDRSYRAETKSGRTDDNASEDKDGGIEGMPCVLAGCHAELNSLLNKDK